MFRAFLLLWLTGSFTLGGFPAQVGGVLPAVERPQETAKPSTPPVDEKTLAGKRFRFSWKQDDRGGVNGIATLKPNGQIEGIGSPNESFWLVDEKGRLIFKHRDGRISSVFDKVEVRRGRYHFVGPFKFRKGIVHYLDEVGGHISTPYQGVQSISQEDAARIRYSNQEFVYLDEGESREFTLKNGAVKRVRLVSVEDVRDPAVKLVRRARVRVEVNGKPVALVSAPYVMPTEFDGLRIQADTTSGWMKIPKRVQLSLWDASDPIVDTKRFRFPLRDYRLFSHGLQAYNEPVHLGHKDGDPSGGRFYHNYGLDLAGFEGRDTAVACADGVVVLRSPADGSVAFEDADGLVWEYGHLDSIDPAIRVGEPVRMGQVVGVLGKKGVSGNFAHLHVGAHLSRDRFEARRWSRNLNLYPWIVTAWLHESRPTLLAVARPHHAAVTGEAVRFDGSNSIAAGSKIVSYRWVFHDGETVGHAEAVKVYEKPGTYVATLWVKDAEGREDVDFCTVRVYTRGALEPVLPTIFATYTPTQSIRAHRTVRFRFWLQGVEQQPLTIDLGGGVVKQGYRPYDPLFHPFERPGIHVVTARTAVNGLPVTQKLKVVVGD